MNTEPAVFAERLTATIERQNGSAALLAHMTGLDVKTIERWMNGDTANPPVNLVAKAAQALGVSVDYLVGLENGEAA